MLSSCVFSWNVSSRWLEFRLRAQLLLDAASRAFELARRIGNAELGLDHPRLGRVER